MSLHVRRHGRTSIAAPLSVTRESWAEGDEIPAELSHVKSVYRHPSCEKVELLPSIFLQAILEVSSHRLQHRLDYCINFKPSLLFLTMMRELFLISVSSLVKEHIVQTMIKA